MPIARVQLPDGRIARLEVPEGTAPAEVEAFVARGLPDAAPAQPDPGSGNTLMGAFKQYLRDVAPGGALSPEITPEGAGMAARIGVPVAAGLAFPPSIPAQMAAAGAGTFGGSMLGNVLEGKQQDLGQSATEAAAAAGTAGLFGSALKLGGNLVGRGVDYIRRNAPSQAAQQYAKQTGAPLPVAPAITAVTKRGSVSSMLRNVVEADEIDKIATNPMVWRSAYSSTDEAAGAVQGVVRGVATRLDDEVSGMYREVLKDIPLEQKIPFKNALGKLRSHWDDWKSKAYINEGDEVAKRVQAALDRSGADDTLTKAEGELLLKDLQRIGRKQKDVSAVYDVTDSIVDDFYKDYDSLVEGSGALLETARKAAKTKADLTKALRYFKSSSVEDIGRARGYLRKLFETRSGAAARKVIATEDPKSYVNAMNMWLNDRMQLYGRTGKVDAQRALIDWINPNFREISRSIGDKRANALRNFLSYVADTSKITKPSFGDAIAGAGASGLTMGGADITLYSLTKALSNPSSKLFQYFSQPSQRAREAGGRLLFGFRPVAIVSGQAGAEAARMFGE